ncbi:MAG: hypothetical protein ABIO02_03525 [Patescibacteria group bacterium]
MSNIETTGANLSRNTAIGAPQTDLHPEMKTYLDEKGIGVQEYAVPGLDYQYLRLFPVQEKGQDEEAKTQRVMLIKPGILNTLVGQTGLAQHLIQNEARSYQNVIAGDGWFNLKMLANGATFDGRKESEEEIVDRDLAVLELALRDLPAGSELDSYIASQGAASKSIKLLTRLLDKGYEVKNIFMDSPVGVEKVGAFGIAKRFVETSMVSLNSDIEAICPSPLVALAAEAKLVELEAKTDPTWSEKQQAMYCSRLLQRTGQYDIVSHNPMLQKSLQGLDSVINDKITAVQQSYDNLAAAYEPQDTNSGNVTFSNKVVDSLKNRIEENLADLDRFMTVRNTILQPIVKDRFGGSYYGIPAGAPNTPNQDKLLKENLFGSLPEALAEGSRLGSAETVEALRELKRKYPDVNIYAISNGHDRLFTQEIFESLLRERVEPENPDSKLLVKKGVRRNMHGHWAYLIDPESTANTVAALANESET